MLSARSDNHASTDDFLYRMVAVPSFIAGGPCFRCLIIYRDCKGIDK